MLNLDTHMLVRALESDVTPSERRLLTKEPWGISAIVLWEARQAGSAGVPCAGPCLTRRDASIGFHSRMAAGPRHRARLDRVRFS